MSEHPLATTVGQAIEEVLISGDLAGLTAPQRIVYYNKVCESIGVNPLTRPFDYLRLNNKLVLYANRSCTDQLRKVHQVSITGLDVRREGSAYVVVARGESKGRKDAATGVVDVGKLAGDFLANAMMKAETKAKRRLTLSLCGLGWLDESEVDSIQGAQRVAINPATGELPEPPPPSAKPEAARVPPPTRNLNMLRKQIGETLLKVCDGQAAAKAECLRLTGFSSAKSIPDGDVSEAWQSVHDEYENWEPEDAPND